MKRVLIGLFGGASVAAWVMYVLPQPWSSDHFAPDMAANVTAPGTEESSLAVGSAGQAAEAIASGRTGSTVGAPGLPNETPDLVFTSRTPLTVADKLAIYELAAGADAARAGRLIDETLEQPEGPARGLALSVLTERLAELDPLAAARKAAAADLGLDAQMLAAVFSTAAAAEPQATLTAFSNYIQSDQRRHVAQVGHALLERIRTDGALIERWLDVVAILRHRLNSVGPVFADLSLVTPLISRSRFTSMPLGDLESVGLTVLAEVDHDAALDRLIALASVDASTARRLRNVLPALDPRAALERADALADAGVRNLYRTTILSAWAAEEPRDALGYLARIDWGADGEPGAQPIDVGSIASQALSSGTDPVELLELARSLPAALAEGVRDGAIMALARRDPVVAIAYVDALPFERRRDVAHRIARSYAELDPEAALAWASSQPVSDVEAAVLSTVARNDPDLALELAIDRPTRARADVLAAVLESAVRNDPRSAPRLARRLAERLPGSALYENAVIQLTETFVSREPEAGLDWLVNGGADLPRQAYERAVRALWRRPEITAAYVDRVPAEARTDWIATVAGGFAQYDTDRALRWIERFRGDPREYGRAAADIVRSTAQTDAPLAARIFAAMPANADPADVRLAVDNLASMWAEDDPRAAADWARSIADEPQRRHALTRVARAWTTKDPDGARAWLLRQPADTARDDALMQHLVTTLDRRWPSAGDLAAFGSDETRRRAVLSIATNAASRWNAAAARDWLDGLRLEADMREQAGRMLDQLEAMRNGRAPAVPDGGAGAIIVLPSL